MNSIRKKWKTLQPAVEAYGRKAIETLYSEIGRDIIKKMASDAAAASRLGNVDESLYSHYTWLMSVYEEVVTFYESYREDVSDPEIRGIIDGIITVLFSRMRGFAETAPEDGSNPIANEKEAMIAQTGEHLKEAATIQWQVFFSEPWGSVATAQWVQGGMHKHALMPFVEATRSRIFPYLYGAYRESLILCRDQLNDFERRKAVQFYQAVMEDEREILSTIIRIQVQALEQASIVEDSSLEDNPQEAVVHKVLSLLREAYQRFGKSSAEVLTALSEPGGQHEPEVCDYSTFEAFLSTCLEGAEYPRESALEDRVRVFKLQVQQVAESLLERSRLGFSKSLHRFSRAVGQEITLANKVTDVFVALRDNWPEVKETEGAEILRGVSETIEIKIEGLRESIGQLKDECSKTIDSFAIENTAPTDDEIQTAKTEVWQLWAKNPDDFNPNSIYSNTPMLIEKRSQQEKNTSRCHETIEKQLQKFKRETLLYEISTYEEIIFYSVSRLRTLESPECQQGAALADDTLILLEALLKRNHIEIIRPQPHDPFNSKEHEVLMAESAPDFTKGEIIKLMTSGYRQNDVVLLRANVIAAR